MVAGLATVPVHDDEKPTEKELAAITDRGRALAEYDAAAWHATDALQTANPKTSEGQHYLAKKENGRWIVVFGALNADKTKFLISYEATQLEKPSEFGVKKYEPAKEDEGFYLFAARAMELTMADAGKTDRRERSARAALRVLVSGADKGRDVSLGRRCALFSLG